MKNNIKNDLKETLYELMPKCYDDRQPMSYFRQMTGLSRRVITELFLEMREEYPICTERVSPGGYWIGNNMEIKNTINMLTNTVNTMQKSITNLQNQLED